MTTQGFRIETHPFRAQWVGILLGTLFMAAVLAGMASPRTFALTLPLVAVAFAVWRLMRGTRAMPTDLSRSAIGIYAAFLLYAALTVLWSIDPRESLLQVGQLVLATGAGLIAGRIVLSDTNANSLRFGEGLWMALLFGAAYLAIEVLSGQAIKIFAFNAYGVAPESVTPAKFYTWRDGVLVRVAMADLTRNIPPLVVLLAPAMLAVVSCLSRPYNRILCWAMYLLAAIAVVCSGSESSKMAFLIASVTGVLAWRWRDAMWRVLAGAWVASCLLVIPIVYTAHAVALHENSLVKSVFKGGSVSSRAAIWRHYAARVGEAPILGHGAYMTYLLDSAEREAAIKAGKEKEAWVRPHPHNVYLQIWFEFGAIGALLFAAVGIAVLQALRTLPNAAQPYAFATFAAAAAVVATSYGIWQAWLICLGGFLLLAAAIAVRTARLADDVAALRSQDRDPAIAAVGGGAIGSCPRTVPPV
ncbi:MAG: O-antigen ligase family protein [Hyphomicrobium sp.]